MRNGKLRSVLEQLHGSLVLNSRQVNIVTQNAVEELDNQDRA